MSKAVLIRNGQKNESLFTPPKLLSDLLPDLPLPCGGKGMCGKCRVRVQGKTNPPTPEERSVLSRTQLSDGLRLACRTIALGDVTIRYGEAASAQKAQVGAVVRKKPLGNANGIAIDVGTTTLYAAVYDLQTGEKRAESVALNPQIRFGADVLSRIAAQMHCDRQTICRTIRNALFDLCADALTKARLAPNDVDAAVLVGNTAMLYLLYDLDAAPLSAAPFACEHMFGGFYPADFLPVKRGTKIFIPRCISAFLGADTVAASIACAIPEKNSVLMTDLGTNGETILRVGDHILGCSCAAGPAFEGVGLECGMQASDGAVRSVQLTAGQYVFESIGTVPPKGICGSGVSDFIACMRRKGDLNAEGLMCVDRLYLGDTPVYLSQKDVRAFQLAKSAVRTGIEILLREAGTDAVQELLLCGSFGSALRLRSAAQIGLIPPALLPVARSVGNAAAQGAAMILLDDTCGQISTSFADQVQTVSLADDADFNNLLCKYLAF